MDTAVLVAVIAAAISLVVSLITAMNARRMQTDENQNTLRLQEQRLRTELRTEFMAEEAIHQLLRHEEWRRRSFGVISYHIRGFTDNELRKMLVSAGAVAFDGDKLVDGKPVEFWGLRTRNSDLLGYMKVGDDKLRSAADVAGPQAPG